MHCIIIKEKKRKYEPPVPTRVGKKKKKLKGPDAVNKLPTVCSSDTLSQFRLFNLNIHHR